MKNSAQFLFSEKEQSYLFAKFDPTMIPTCYLLTTMFQLISVKFELLFERGIPNQVVASKAFFSHSWRSLGLVSHVTGIQPSNSCNESSQ